jgi:hypothetical protein
VNKKAGQTITVSGTDAVRVTQAESGTTVDGSEAGDELAVFTVETERWDEGTGTSTMFYGTGNHTIAVSTGNVPDTSATLTFAPVSFNLVVEEPYYDSKTVQVEVEVEPDLTGVAVFKVESETLTRVPAGDIRYWTDTTQQGNRLIDAIAWIDKTDQTGEYLVRVEASEAIPLTYLLFTQDIELRLRGYGVAKEITHNGVMPTGNMKNNTNGYVNFDKASGQWAKATYPLIGGNKLALTLEDKVTLKGRGFDASPPVASELPYLYLVGSHTVVMKAGSRITEHNSYTNPQILGAILRVNQFFMKGGSIDRNKVGIYGALASSGYLSPLVAILGVGLTGSATLEQFKPFCIKTGGMVADNVRVEFTTGAIVENDFIKVKCGDEYNMTEFEQ